MRITRDEKGKLLLFYILAFIISWAIWSPYYLPIYPETWRYSHIPHYLGLLGPLVASIILHVQAGTFNDLVRSITIPRGPVWCWMVALLAPFALLLVAALISSEGRISNLQIHWPGTQQVELGLSTLPFLALNLLVVGFGEEGGWRGYALPRLQARLQPVYASMAIAALWGLWHLPLFFCPVTGFYTMAAAGIAGWIFSLITGSILFTWIFNASRGSVLLCAFFHASMDIAFMFDFGHPEMQTYVGAGVTIWGIAVLIWMIRVKNESTTL